MRLSHTVRKHTGFKSRSLCARPPPRRWLSICPVRKNSAGDPEKGGLAPSAVPAPFPPPRQRRWSDDVFGDDFNVPSGTARTRYAQSRRCRKARRSGPHQSGFRREIGEAVYRQWPWTSSARLVHGLNRGAPSSSDDQGLLSTPQSEGQRVPSRDCPLPAQVTYDLKRADEDEPRVAKQNDRLRFPQTLVATSSTHPRRGDPLRGCSLRCDPL